MFNITNILVKIFAWALIFCNSVQLEIRTFSAANIGKKSHFRMYFCATNHNSGYDMCRFMGARNLPFFILHSSLFIPHSSFLIRHSSLLSVFFTLIIPSFCHFSPLRLKNARFFWPFPQNFHNFALDSRCFVPLLAA